MQALDIDFLQPRPGPRPLAWLLLITGLLAMAAVLLDWQAAQAEWQAAQAQAERQARLQQRQRPVRAGAPAPALAPEAIKAGQRIEAALNQPWGGLLSDLESLSDAPVVLLGLDAQAEGRSVRLSGEARHMDDVVRYIERLRALPSARSALLVTHETRREGEVDVLRFGVDMQWQTSAPAGAPPDPQVRP